MTLLENNEQTEIEAVTKENQDIMVNKDVDDLEEDTEASKPIKDDNLDKEESKESKTVKSENLKIEKEEENRQNDFHQDLKEYEKEIEELRVKIEGEDSLQPLSDEEKQWMTKRRLHCFLKARKFNLKKAAKMMISSMKWRREHKPDQLKATDQLKEINKHGFIYSNFYYEKGWSILFITLKNDKSLDVDAGEKLNLLLYMIEGIMDYTRDIDENAKARILLLIDVEGVSRKQIQMQVIKLWLTTMQNNYPETLGGCAIVNLPKMLGSLFKVISLVMDSETKKKIHILCNHSSSDDKTTRTRSKSISFFSGRTRTRRATSMGDSAEVVTYDKPQKVRKQLEEKLGEHLDINNAFPPHMGGENPFVFNEETFYEQFEEKKW